MKDYYDIKSKGKTLFNRVNDSGKRMNYYVLYTLAFFLLFFVIYSIFYINGKTFIYTYDGINQHFISLTYYGQWLRKILKGVLFDFNLTIPMWDLSIGYGSDIITTLHYYVLGDPLNLLSALVPSRYTQYLYEFLIILRIYLAGMAFSYYARSHGNKKTATLTGTVIYCFSGYVLLTAVRHPYFTNSLIYFPLILVGADRILQRKKPVLFIGMLAVACISNFYFAYMTCILTIIYVVVRYVFLEKRLEWKKTWRMFLRFIFFAMIAIALAGVVMIPVVNLLLGTHRLKAENSVLLVYPLSYYIKMIGNYTSGNNSYWTCLGFSSFSVIAIACLFLKKKQYKELKVGFVLLTVMLCIPYIGKVMNGFSYICNRWAWGYAGLIAYIVVKMVPELSKLKANEIVKISGCVLLYIGFSLLSHLTRTEVNAISAVLIVVFCGFLLLGLTYDRLRTSIRFVALGITILSVSINGFYLFALQEDNYIDSFIDAGQAYERVTSNLPSDLVKRQKDKGKVRYDQIASFVYDNTAMVNKLNTTSYYFSLNNGYISEYLDEMYLNIAVENVYKNLDGRSILDALASVKYFIIPKKGVSYVPYLYKNNKVSSLSLKDLPNTDYVLYQAKNYLPLGYTYDSYIKREVYDAMTVADKQEALLQGVVLDQSSAKSTQLSLNNREIPYEMTFSGDIEVKDGVFQVNSTNAKVTLSFSGISNSETYLIFDKLKYTSQHPLDLISEKDWESLTLYQQNSAKVTYRDWYKTSNTNGRIKVTNGKVSSTIRSLTPDYNFYSGKSNYLVNLGYDKKQATKITLTFYDTGLYEFEDMKVVCQPMDNIVSQIKKLNENTLEQIKIDNNKVTGSITCDKDKILCMSIPYSEGWTAYVDGKQVELKRANTMFMAIELTSGEHRIELRYQTPYLMLGGIVSIIGVVLYVLVILFYKRKKLCKTDVSES